MKHLIIILLLVVVLVLGGYFYSAYSTTVLDITTEVTDTAPTFAPEIEKVLSEEKVIIQSLANEQVLIEETRAANERNKSITEVERNTLDTEWKNAKEVTPSIREFLENTTATFLLDFQKQHPEYKEIFVADAYGLNVGQTDKTSDYYQADEAWWMQSFNNGEGKLANGEIEFDESSQTESISIYAPIIDPATGEAIGVLKAVLDVSSFVNKL